MGPFPETFTIIRICCLPPLRSGAFPGDGSSPQTPCPIPFHYPEGWHRRVRSAVVHAISLAGTSLALTRGCLISPSLRPLRCLRDRLDSYPAGTTFTGAGHSPGGITSLLLTAHVDHYSGPVHQFRLA